MSKYNTALFEHWFGVVQAAFENDVTDNDGWGFADRYEAKSHNGLATHEQLVRQALDNAGFVAVQGRPYPNQPNSRPDGVVSNPLHGESTLRYEMKSVYLPHNHLREHPHNEDFVRLLRYEHPSGALSDVSRLKTASDATRVFLLVGISWCEPREVTKLKTYEWHRDVLLETFAHLAGLGVPVKIARLAGSRQPWSATIRAWAV